MATDAHPAQQIVNAQQLVDGARPLYEMSVAEARVADLAAVVASGGAKESVGSVTDLTVDGPGGDLRLRVYRPTGVSGPLATILYFFGGGWTLGSIDTSDGVCRALVNRSGCAAVAVGYRLAPEHPFPAAVLDCSYALSWIVAEGSAQGLDGTRVVVAGDSAGGNLAAAIALHARDNDGPDIRAQILIYPNTLYGADTRSMRRIDDRSLFNHHSVRWYWRHYLADAADGRDPLASPLLADDHSGLPPALIITATEDPLCDEGESYADALRASGVVVTCHRYTDMAHGFFTMSGTLEAARRAVDEVARFIRIHIEPSS